PALLLAEALVRHDRLPQAIRLADRMVEHHPGDDAALLAAARYRLLAGDLDGAEARFRRVSALAPASPAPPTGLARVARAPGPDGLARAEVERARSLSPADVESRELARELGLR